MLLSDVEWFFTRATDIFFNSLLYLARRFGARFLSGVLAKISVEGSRVNSSIQFIISWTRVSTISSEIFSYPVVETLPAQI